VAGDWKVVEGASGVGDWSDGEVALVPERVMSPPPATEAPASGPDRLRRGRPVIFDDCTIDVEMWNSERHDTKVRVSFEVRGNAVTGHGEGRNKGARTENGFVGEQPWTARFEGSLQDNVFTGRVRHVMHVARGEHNWTEFVNGRDVRRQCVYEWNGESNGSETWTFQAGGQGRCTSPDRPSSTAAAR